jgi:hypothetical protein
MTTAVVEHVNVTGYSLEMLPLIWQGQADLGEITLSTASRENSHRFINAGEYYIVLKDASAMKQK